MKIFFLLNPTRRKDLWDIREEAARAARGAGWTAYFGGVDRRKPKSTERLVDQALDEGCSRIAAVGGDGTFHRVIAALHEKERLRDTDVALVLAGTCNDFSRYMGASSRRFNDALRLACRGRVRKIDLGTFRCGAQKIVRPFLNNAGFGRRSPVKAGTRRSAWKTLKSFQPMGMRLEWEKGSLEGRFLFGVVCNAPYFSRGLYFSRHPDVQDGFLDAYLVPEMPRWKLAASLLRGRLGGTLMMRGVFAIRAVRFDLRSEGDLWPQADGEPPPEKPVRSAAFGLSSQKAMIVFPS